MGDQLIAAKILNLTESTKHHEFFFATTGKIDLSECSSDCRGKEFFSLHRFLCAFFFVSL